RIEMQHFGVKVSIVEHGFFKAEDVNSDILEKHIFKLWNRLTPEIRDSYGEKYLVECKSSVKTLCDYDTSNVIKCMEHALIAKYPRTRYRAGWDAKFFWLFLCYAPSCLSDML
ncbi:RDH16 dehydrogenase, partial [Chloropsis hardwickii]|nr:RDH16 dehydrogenase [Chloropsis hardwickii]